MSSASGDTATLQNEFTVSQRAGASLLDCARQLGVDLVNLRGGMGTCGRCKVQILDGSVSELASNERELLTRRNEQEVFGHYL